MIEGLAAALLSPAYRQVDKVRIIPYIVFQLESRMSIALEEFSTITAKGQTTVPKAVRQALGVDYGGRIAFRVSDGGVTVCRADSDEDPAIETFLGFLAADIKAHPQAIKALSPDLAARITSLTGDMTINLDDEIDGDVSL